MHAKYEHLRIAIFSEQYGALKCTKFKMIFMNRCFLIVLLIVLIMICVHLGTPYKNYIKMIENNYLCKKISPFCM